MWFYCISSYVPGDCLHVELKNVLGRASLVQEGKREVLSPAVFFIQLIAAGLRPTELKETEWGERKGSFLSQSVGTQNGCENVAMGCTYSPLQAFVPSPSTAPPSAPEALWIPPCGDVMETSLLGRDWLNHWPLGGQMRASWFGSIGSLGSIPENKKGQHHSDPWWEMRKSVAVTWEVRSHFPG